MFVPVSMEKGGLIVFMRGRSSWYWYLEMGKLGISGLVCSHEYLLVMD